MRQSISEAPNRRSPRPSRDVPVRGVSPDVPTSIIFGCFVLTLIVAPFWFGGVAPLNWGLNLAWLSALVAAYEALLIARGAPHPVAPGRVIFAIAPVALVCLWVGLQSIRWPGELTLGDTFAQPIWALAAQALQRDPAASLSVDPERTWRALLRLLAACATFWLALQLCRNKDRARQLIAAIALAGLAYATYGIVAFFVFPQTILWFSKTSYVDVLTSTFVNRNSYATYAGIGLLASLTLAFRHVLGATPSETSGFGRRAARVMSSVIGRGGIWIGCGAIIGMALVLTGSRGGIASSLFAIIAMLIVLPVRHSRNAGAAGLAIFVTVFIIAAVLFGFGDIFADRLAAVGLSSDDRLAVYQLTLLSIFDSPLRGFGYGTFESVFPWYRDASLSIVGHWDLAHNTYVEMFQGLAILPAALFFAAIVWLGWLCLRAVLNRQSSATAPLCAVGATVLVALHAMVDFSMQIQAIALTWSALLGAGVAQSWSRQVQTER